MRIGLVVLFVFSLLFVPAGQARPTQDRFPEGPGKATFIMVCAMCHDVDRVATYRYSRDEWKDLVDSMKAMGGEATDEEWTSIVDYLAKNFPRE